MGPAPATGVHTVRCFLPPSNPIKCAMDMTANFFEFVLSTRTMIDELGHGYNLPQQDEFDDTFEFV